MSSKRNFGIMPKNESSGRNPLNESKASLIQEISVESDDPDLSKISDSLNNSKVKYINMCLNS